jgi:hypothetical protein
VELPDSRDPVLGEQRQCNHFGWRAAGGHALEVYTKRLEICTIRTKT